MAVPKKRTSKTKSKTRKSKWKEKANHASAKALILGKAALSGKANSLIYLGKDPDIKLSTQN